MKRKKLRLCIDSDDENGEGNGKRKGRESARRRTRGESSNNTDGDEDTDNDRAEADGQYIPRGLTVNAWVNAECQLRARCSMSRRSGVGMVEERTHSMLMIREGGER